MDICFSETCTEIGILDIFGFENFPKNSFEQVSLKIDFSNSTYHFCHVTCEKNHGKENVV